MRAKRLFAAAAIAATLLTTAASPANAVEIQSNVCGSSFSLIDRYYKSGDGHSAVLRLYYSSAYQQNCAVMAKTSGTGHKDQMGVWIRPTGGTVDRTGGVESGWFYSYAGPVYTDRAINMSGRCVDVDGFVADEHEVFIHIRKTGVHCG